MADDDYITEAEALTDILSGNEFDFDDEECVYDNREKINEYLARYNKNKEAKLSSIIKCPVCGKSILKTTYHRIFCKNKRCKDTYWNTVDDKRRTRAKLYK